MVSAIAGVLLASAIANVPVENCSISVTMGWEPKMTR